MDDYFDIIRSNRLFDGISDELLRSVILPRGRIKLYAPGSSVFGLLDRVDRIHILLSGKIRLEYYTKSGEQDIKSLLFPPRMIGVDLICTRTQSSPYQATVVEQSRVFSFPAELLLKPGIVPEGERLCCIDNLLRILSNVNMQNEYRLAILKQSGLRDRIMVFLTMQANKAQSDTFTIPFSREEMASFLRVNRSALSHELSLLRQAQVIDFHKNRFTLLSRPGGGEAELALESLFPSPND